MVTRPGMNAATEALLASRDVFYPTIACFVDWVGDPSWSHSGRGVLQTLGRGFEGIGPAGRIRVPSEEVGLVPAVAELEIVGVPDRLLGQIGRTDARGRRVQLWVGFVTEPAGNVLMPGTALIEWFTGFILKQRIRIEVADDTTILQSLMLTVGSGPRGRASASITHSYEDQRAKYPADTAGRHTIYAEKNARREFWTP